MGSNAKWIAILVIAQFSAVLCRNSFYEYYYSRYHHKRTTTEALSSSISDISSEENTRPSVAGSTAEALSSSESGDIIIGNILHGAAGNTILQNILNSGKGDQAVEVDRNITNILYGGTYGTPGSDAGMIVGIFFIPIIFGLVICCCCCGKLYHKEQKGFILGNQDLGARSFLPEQNTINYAQLPSYTGELTQQHATHYQSRPVLYLPPMYNSNPASQVQPYVLESPPPAYDAPSYGAPPLEIGMANNGK